MENIAADISGKGKDNLGRSHGIGVNRAPYTGKSVVLLHSSAFADLRTVDFPQ
ncbi:MAG: hypothetical protein NT113_23050 [Hyphomicrobiales bacterium]|jgi:hypothetical protein|nr:hypothetical protein [Hyphomicrobiales bacterium]